jgi:tRNA A-37 threonylcarbamoyl transferase component Bud32
MSVREMASTTMLWVKEFSTSIFLRMGKRFFKVGFIQRNKKRIALCVSAWLLGTLVGYLVFRNAVGGLKNDVYQLGSSVTQKLATKTGPLLLEKNILSLNMAISEAATSEGVIFAGIIDHEDKIVAHTDPNLVSQPFTPVKDARRVRVIEKVSIDEGSLPDNREIICFSSDVTYAGIRIGKLYLVQSASGLYSVTGKYRTLFVWGVVLGILLVSAIVVVLDRVSVGRISKVKREPEGGTQMGPYILREKIGQGGMAELFLSDYVREDSFRRILAVKRVLPHLADSSEFVRMLAREARLAALLQHPNIVQVIDFGRIQDAYFIAMEYIHGKNLAEIMARLKKGLAVDQAIFIVSQICKGLHYSHTKKDDKSGRPLKIVHRDISPQNILVSFQGEVKISDFGISKALSEPSLTKADIIKGKLSYLSPEHALGQTIDHRSDLYALGIVIYEILSARRLYRFTSDIEAIRSIPEKDVAPIKELRPDIPDALNNIVMKCLEKDRKTRYQSAQEVLDDLTPLRHSLSMTFDASDLAKFMKKHFQIGHKSAR